MANQTTSGGISVAGLLGVAFVVLKLTHVIDWSWWWVTCPFLGHLGIVLAIVLIVILFKLIFFLIEVLVDWIGGKKRRIGKILRR